MKKLMSLLLVGVAIIVLSGCTDKIDDDIEYVDTTQLYKGYLITGENPNASATITDVKPMGTTSNLMSIKFCDSDYYNSTITWDVKDPVLTNFYLMDENKTIMFGCSGYSISTADAATPGSLDVGVTYILMSEDNYWKVTNIKKVECTVDDEI